MSNSTEQKWRLFFTPPADHHDDGADSQSRHSCTVQTSVAANQVLPLVFWISQRLTISNANQRVSGNVLVLIWLFCTDLRDWQHSWPSCHFIANKWWLASPVWMICFRTRLLYSSSLSLSSLPILLRLVPGNVSLQRFPSLLFMHEGHSVFL